MQKVLRQLLSFSVRLLALGLILSTMTAAEPQPTKSPLGLPLPQQAPAPSTPAAATPSSPLAGSRSNVGALSPLWNWVLTTQSALNRDMATAVKNLKSDSPVRAALALIAIAFGYGVLHAAGPGHGKSVISAYVLTNRETVRRGVALSFLSALIQAFSAIVFFGIMTLVLKQTSIQMRATEATIETISWGLVAAVGAYLLWRQVAPFLNRKRDDLAERGHTAHIHDHGPNCACGHSHMASPRDLQGDWSWSKALPLAFSVGIRPCSGAILLLIFALSQGMLWAGIVGTFAMALGTAITVSALAALAVSSREWAARVSGPGSLWAERIQTAAGFAGAALVFILGVTFFVASLRGPGPL
jgi:nickel/cobalt transporter (NicO) family protein